MVSVVEPARALIDPLDGLRAAVARRRWALPLVALMASSALSGALFASKVDATPRVISGLEQAGLLRSTPEAEVLEKITTAERLSLVGAIARGLLLVPLLVLLLALGVKLLGWLLDRTVAFGAAFSLCALALLPVALHRVALALAAGSAPALEPADRATLVPSSLAALGVDAGPPLRALLPAVDFFALWSVLLLGLGFASLTAMRRRWAVPLWIALYALYVGVSTFGLGLGGGPRG